MYDAAMPDLAEQWTGMVRDQQIAMRQSPLVALRNSVGEGNYYSQNLDNRQENHAYPPT